MSLLTGLGVTAVLNCASGGIRSLPLDEFEASGIQYEHTNVAQGVAARVRVT